METSSSNQLGAVAAAPWLIVAAGFHFRGGMDRANAQLASYLLRCGAEVHLVGHDVDPAFLADHRAKVHLVPRPAGSLGLGEFGLDRRGRTVARLLEAKHARVVVNGGNCQWPAVNWVHYVHHAWQHVDPAAPWWFKAKHRVFSARWRQAEVNALQRAGLIISNSERTSRDVLTHAGVPRERVRTIYLGTEAGIGPATSAERAAARQWLGLETNRPTVAFVGALGLDRRKGFDTLWNAWVSLCSTPDWDADLIVAGGGSDIPFIRDAADRAGLSSRVRLLGHSDRISDVLAAADLLVSPVRYEPYGLNVQEAICRGLPALVSRSAGVAERYPSDLSDMLLTDSDDVEELVRSLRRWRPQKDAWTARVIGLGRQLRSYTWDDMSAAIVETVVSGQNRAVAPAPATRVKVS